VLVPEGESNPTVLTIEKVIIIFAKIITSIQGIIEDLLKTLVFALNEHSKVK